MQEHSSCKNKFLFYPSCQNVTIPQHVDQKRVKDVTHNSTTRTKNLCCHSCWLLLLSAALSALPNPSAGASASCRSITPILFGWLLCYCPVASLCLSAGASTSCRAFHLLVCVASIVMPVASASLPLSSRLCISLHCFISFWFG